MISKHAGFSLLEVLVTLTIIAIVFTTVMASYVSLVNIRERIDTSRQLQREANFALSRSADRIRAASIDYDAYEINGNCGPQHNQNHVLCLQDETMFQLVQTQDRSSWQMNDQPLFSSPFTVEELHVTVTPTADPQKVFEKEAQLQPKVTLFLSVASIKYPSVVLKTQTTISSRLYQ